MKSQRELDNIRKIIKEFYDRREKKIVLLALDQSKTKSNLVDYSHMLREERDFFDQLTRILDSFRDGILGNILNERMPAIHTSLEQKSSQARATFQSSSSTPFIRQEIETDPIKKEFQDQSSPLLDDQKPTALVRFLYAVPKFVGPELDEYGPFSEDDIASLPREIAQVLLSKGRVEPMREQ